MSELLVEFVRGLEGYFDSPLTSIVVDVNRITFTFDSGAVRTLRLYGSPSFNYCETANQFKYIAGLGTRISEYCSVDIHYNNDIVESVTLNIPVVSSDMLTHAYEHVVSITFLVNEPFCAFDWYTGG